MADQQYANAQKAYQSKLQEIINMGRLAIKASTTPGLQLEGQPGAEIERQLAPLEKQLNRLSNNEFIIAVVGREKAGKSTFVNAWLNYDLLPSKSERCTYTTTRVHGASENEQKLVVTVYSTDEFAEQCERLVSSKNSGGADESRRASEDLTNIARATDRLNNILAEGNKVILFKHFNEIADKLQMYISDKSVAYAIKSVDLFTSSLVAQEGVVFYDVPGLDSGLDIHLEESKKILQDCDAIVVIQRADQPDLVEAEKKLAGYMLDGEVQVPVSSKLFVFINKIDMLTSPQALADNSRKALDNWKAIADVKSHRLISGSAIASLLNDGDYISEETNEYHGTQIKEDLLRRIADITGINRGDAEALRDACGISNLKKQIRKFLDNDRIDLLKQRCDPAIEKIKRLAATIHATGSRLYGDNPNELQQRFREGWERRFAVWVDEYVSEIIEQAINPTYESALDPKEADKKLYDAYLAMIKTNIIIESVENTGKRDAIFAEHLSTDENLEGVNLGWRAKIDAEMKICIENLGQSLAIKISEAVMLVIEEMKRLLWDDGAVEEILVKSKEHYNTQLHSGVNALLLRFTRPLVSVFIAAPRGFYYRTDVISKLQRDLLALESYSKYPERPDLVSSGPVRLTEESNPAQPAPVPSAAAPKGLFGGKGAAPPPAVRPQPEVHPIVERTQEPQGPVPNILSLAREPGIEQYKTAEIKILPDTKEIRLGWIIKEVMQDMEIVMRALSFEVFRASGVTDYRLQEFRKVRRRFTEARAEWRGITRNAFDRRHPRLMQILPPELQNVEPDVERAEIFGGLKDAIRTA